MTNLKTFTEAQIQELTAAGRYRTARAYQSAFNKLNAFFGREADFGDICYDAMKDFEGWMQRGHLTPNTTSFYVRNVRAIYNKGAKAGVFVADGTENPFSGVFTGVAKTVKRALEEGEIRRLVAVVKKDKKTAENDALQLFQFCFYAQGMSFADAVFLKKSAVSGGIISYRRRKTGREVFVAVTEPVRRIIDSFSDRTAGSEFVFPFIKPSDRFSEYRQYCTALSRQNRLLKPLGKLFGISRRPLTTHAARHSWASAARNHGVGLAVISAALGHSSEATTQIYLNQLDNHLLARANGRIAQVFFRTLFCRIWKISAPSGIRQARRFPLMDAQ